MTPEERQRIRRAEEQADLFMGGAILLIGVLMAALAFYAASC